MKNNINNIKRDVLVIWDRPDNKNSINTTKINYYASKTSLGNKKN
jgi:hypothetical protein